jgi:hypothetical protein
MTAREVTETPLRTIVIGRAIPVTASVAHPLWQLVRGSGAGRLRQSNIRRDVLGPVVEQAVSVPAEKAYSDFFYFRKSFM